MDACVAKIKEEIAKLKGQRVDIVYHPHSTYRMIKQEMQKLPHCFAIFLKLKWILKNTEAIKQPLLI